MDNAPPYYIDSPKIKVQFSIIMFVDILPAYIIPPKLAELSLKSELVIYSIPHPFSILIVPPWDLSSIIPFNFMEFLENIQLSIIDKNELLNKYIAPPS